MDWGSAARRLFEVGSRVADVLDHWLLDNAALAVWEGPRLAPPDPRQETPIKLDFEGLTLSVPLTRSE